VAGSLPVDSPLLGGSPLGTVVAQMWSAGASGQESASGPGWLGPGTGILLAALLILVVAVLVFWLWPRLLLRAGLWLLVHTVYRIEVRSREHVPAQGGALLVCNHVRFLDWLLLQATLRRHISFVVIAPYAHHWLWGRLVRWAGAIAIDGAGGPKSIVQALRRASDTLNRGSLVCIFAEGSLTRTGFLLPFHRAFEHILRRSPVPIVPVCLDQVWGSIFRCHHSQAFWKRPRPIPYPVRAAYGLPLTSDMKAAEVRLAIQKLSADCALAQTRECLPVHRQFVRTAARHPLRPCFIDPNARQGAPLSYGKALAGAMCFAQLLRPILAGRPMIGVWLPCSMGGALANIALALLGKTSVNLNYTSCPEFLESAIQQCGLRHVLTSRRFVERLPAPFGHAVELIYLEDFVPKVSTWARLRAFLAVLLCPGFVLDRWVLRLGGHKADDLATIIFSSGSTGEPKGVMLTHGNIAANVGSMIQAIGLHHEDRVLGILPFFHSFGYTVTLWAPLQVGASLVYYPDPRQAKEIGELCRQHRCSIFLTTPTFLRFCLRRCEPTDFQTLRILMCGAEKLPPSLAQEFKGKFGVEPLEGYGCTELAPAAAANVPDVEVLGVRQVGNKPGTIGLPLPGVAARVAHPDTLEPLPPGEEGVLLMYGANVMKGYLGQEEKTRAVVRDGWYVTGDIARIDPDGFVAITGRLSRFAKIGGEMVPLQRIEEELHVILDTTDQVCAVTAVPDEKKGERVVVLHLPLSGTDVRQLSEVLGTRGLPSLGLPGERDFFQVPEMPVLGSGKLDLKRLKEMAVERAGKNGG
jgi:acyl-[acyl-carrier-protein]-phospholipid O-acyltransferase/long-chain-fatty-acid--[acyl-carrier-protein] ligase